MRILKRSGKDDFSLAYNEKEKDIYLISKNLRERWVNYVWQSAAAGIITIIVLYIFFELIALIILAGVGSTIFTIFALPFNRTANTRNIIGSYLICIVVGLFCIYITNPSLSGGAAIGISTFLMVITDTEHPPAAGVALGLSMANSIDDAYGGVIFAFIGALIAVFLRRILLPWLKNLI